MDVDVAESEVHWGKFLRVRVQIDVTKKIVRGKRIVTKKNMRGKRIVTKKNMRGKRIVIEGGEQRWISFKYERLPNFCYHCGLLSHGLKDCEEMNGVDEQLDLSKLQYGVWLHGEASRRGVGDITKVGHEEGRANRG